MKASSQAIRVDASWSATSVLSSTVYGPFAVLQPVSATSLPPSKRQPHRAHDGGRAPTSR